MADFKKAEEIDPENADIFHHRGQVNLLTEQVDSAAEDFNKAVTLNPNFPVAYVQKLYTDYRKAMQQNDQTAVKNVINSFFESYSHYIRNDNLCAIFTFPISLSIDFKL